ncbi:hypothetical protein C8J56DRAFT_1058785 [Mycena floridula]|nr:hypothetical protein C8J56DRAFT_1058785 [Mycena floridula]
MCTVSRLFKEIAQQRLYAVLDLNDDKQPNIINDIDALFCAKPEYARSRRLSVSSSFCLSPSTVIKAIYSDTWGTRILDRILWSTPELRRLSLSNWEKLWPGFGSWSFPHLCRLKLIEMWDLGTQPAALEHLFLVSTSAILRIPVHLPNLQVVTYQIDGYSATLPNASNLHTVWLSPTCILDDLSGYPGCEDVVLDVKIKVQDEIQHILWHLKHSLPRLKRCLLILHSMRARTQEIITQEIWGFKHLKSFGILPTTVLAARMHLFEKYGD